jgi:hypothetical protein
MKESARNRVFSLALLAGLGACAAEKGDEIECPECDNETTVLVGDRCVSIDEVDPCGPDGHLHGDECHCFDGQDPTSIGGTQYCLQAECGTHEPEDHSEHEH